MLKNILKNWTLPVAMLTGTLGYLFFANVPAFDPVARWAGPVFDRILPLFMFMILFVTFCKVDFHRMRPVAWHFWAGVTQIAFILVTMALILAYRPVGHSLVFIEALLVCIIAPCAAAAAVVMAGTMIMLMSVFVTMLVFMAVFMFVLILMMVFMRIMIMTHTVASHYSCTCSRPCESRLRTCSSANE